MSEHPSVRLLHETHHVVWAEYRYGGGLGVSHRLECSCGAEFVRPRLADCAVALERHQARPHLNPGDRPEAPRASCLPTGNRRRHGGESLPSEAL